MARIRTIKPDFWTDEKVVELSPLARLLFIGLWNFADDEGRMAYSPTRIKLQILPADSADISELLGEIRGKLLVDVYAVDGIEYLQVVNFTDHQKIDKRTASKYPANPNKKETPAESPRVVPTEGKGMEGKLKDTPPPALQSGFEEFWKSWPSSDRKSAKGKCADLWRRKGFESESGAIVAHVSTLKASKDWTKNGGEFIPAPLTYLNQARWQGASETNPTLEALRAEYGKDVRPHGDGYSDGVRQWTKTGERRIAA